MMQFNVVHAAAPHVPSACTALLQQHIFNKYYLFNLTFSLFHWIVYVIYAYLMLGHSWNRDSFSWEDNGESRELIGDPSLSVAQVGEDPQELSVGVMWAEGSCPIVQAEPLWACLYLFQGKVLSPRTSNTTHGCLGTYLLSSTEGNAEGSLGISTRSK